MGKFKKPEGGYYTEEELRQKEEPKRGESGGILVDNLHAIKKVEIYEEKIVTQVERPRENPDDKTEGLRSEVGPKDARVRKSPFRRRKL